MTDSNWRGAGRTETSSGREHRMAADQCWWHIMGYEGGPPQSLAQMERQFRRLASSAHPDRGGDPQRMQLLLRARAEARIQLTP